MSVHFYFIPTMNIQKIRFKGESIAGLQLLLLFNQNWEIRYVLQEIIVLYKVEFDISISMGSRELRVWLPL